MTDDYLAISNTGKNITITMTPGMKQRVLNNIQRVILTCENGYAVITPCGNGLGSKLYKRKRVWNMSVSSRRLANWPKHDRFVVPATGVQLLNFRVVIPLPKTSSEEEFINAVGANILRAARESAPARMDYRDMHMPKFVEDAPPKECRQFNVADMVVAAIAGGAIGVLITLLLAAAGVLK